MATLSEILRERGYVYQHSSEKLEEITDGPKRTFYWGVDPTADSMHVGQLQGMLILRRLVEAGHKLVLLIGDGTGMIGDPGGKSSERVLLDPEVVIKNGEALRAQFEHLLGGVKIETMVRNSEWLSKLNYMEFLRDIGKHFTVNEMIKRDTVRPRIEAPDQSISYTEFSYMLLQAYDFLHLNREFGCDLQVGGSDQWGNIISGVDLIRRVEQKTAYAFSWPLLVDKKTGKKFGKSEGNAVWLDPTKTSPYQFYQFWINVDDDMVEELLLKMTLLEKDQIEGIVTVGKADPALRPAQTHLALAVTELVHGKEAAQNAQKVSNRLFSVLPQEEMTEHEAALIREVAPTTQVKLGQSLLEVLIASELASSNREARQFISDEAIRIGESLVREGRTLEESDFKHGISFLRRGKRRVAVLSLE